MTRKDAASSGIDAAVKALEAQTTEMSAAQRQLELALAKRATRLPMRAGNTTASIRQIGSSRVSWSAGRSPI
jgi:hypothetical protein